MEHRIYRIMCIAFVATTSFITGCSRSLYSGPPTPYAAIYTTQGQSITLSSHAQTKAVGLSWTFSRPIEEVWKGCLQVATQYEGIIHITTDPNGTRKMIFVHGQNVPVKVPFGYINLGMVLPVFIDTLMVVSAESLSPNQTEVAVAWLSPDTGCVEPVSSDLVVGPIEATLTELGRYDALCLRLNKARLPLVSPKVVKKTVAEKRDLVNQVVINKFFQELVVQLQGPNQWRDKFTK